MKIQHMSMAPPALEDAGDRDAPAKSGRRPRARRALARVLVRVAAWAAALLVLAVVFLSYRSPDLMFTLATQVWGCF